LQLINCNLRGLDPSKTQENLKKKLKSSGAQQRGLDPRKTQKKIQKSKSKIKRGPDPRITLLFLNN